MDYIPERGDVIWISLNPQAGHEQAGRRPAVVLSPASYNRKVGLAILCPVTNQVKGYPFEVPIPAPYRRDIAEECSSSRHGQPALQSHTEDHEIPRRGDYPAALVIVWANTATD